MCNVKKCFRSVFVLSLLSITTFVFADQYKINDVKYDIDGITTQFALERAVLVDYETVFETKLEIDTYINELATNLNNLRVLEFAEIFPLFKQSENGIVPVDLIINVKDSINFIAFPMPKYDSTSGFSFKLDSKDYNFLGTMKTFDAELYYELDFKDEDNPTSKDEHTFGVYGSYSYPFSIGKVNSAWNNIFRFDYTVGEDVPSVGYSTGLSFRYKLTSLLALNASITQGMDYGSNYKIYGDQFYFTESASFSLPVTLVKTSSFGTISWTPSVSTSYYWDINGIDPNNVSLYKPTLGFGHSFSLGQTNWVANFKDGFTFSFSQNLSHNFYTNNFSSTNNFTMQYFKAFEYFGLKSRVKLFQTENTSSSYDASLRGVYGSGVSSYGGLTLNIDLPINVWETDWVGYGFWSWMRYVDFEMQISPFLDIALGHNGKTGTILEFEDGLYAGGFEIIGFPKKFRSVQGRISFGVDLVNFTSNIGENVDFADKVVNKLFNTSWRTDNWYELSIGIGLFY